MGSITDPGGVLTPVPPAVSLSSLQWLKNPCPSMYEQPLQARWHSAPVHPWRRVQVEANEHRLAWAYLDQGTFDKAEWLYKRFIDYQIFLNDPDVAKSLS